MNKLVIGIKALRSLGFKQVSLYALYRFGLLTGHYKRILNKSKELTTQAQSLGILSTPAYLLPEENHRLVIIDHATHILADNCLFFGHEWRKLDFDTPGHDLDWTDWEISKWAETVEDIKYLWEPTRFGWLVDLAQAYQLSSDDSMVEFFWRKLEEFDRLNPPYHGANWVSAQEAAIRLIHLGYFWSVTRDSKSNTTHREAKLVEMIAQHADRIPHTLPYARSQNNNHLLSESAGLVTAALLLPEHPRAQVWKELGWKWFEYGIQNQVTDTGEYIQQSYTYHRFMLTLALWMDANRNGREWDSIVKKKLAKASSWYLQITNGSDHPWPVFGSHDSSRILYPFLQNKNNFGFVSELRQAFPNKDVKISPAGLIPISGKNERGYLRVGQFTGRPSHADQLHFDLWTGEINILLDPGTYSYNSRFPWNNTLASSLVHNTIVIDGRDQMSRVSKFLWLDWAQGTIDNIRETSPGVISAISASHNGYHKLGIIHTRKIEHLDQDRWKVIDQLKSKGRTRTHNFRLQWNLPPGKWTRKDAVLNLELEKLLVEISFSCPIEPTYSLITAGNTLIGDHRALPFEGWCSKEYGKKEPCLLLLIKGDFSGDLTFTSNISIKHLDN